MSHLSQSVLPSTIPGIKRLAKSTGRQNDIPHFPALDVVAQRCGYDSFHHARRALERSDTVVKAAVSYSIFLSAYWRDTQKKPVDAGLETLRIELPRPLTSFLKKHECGSARNLDGFFMEFEDHLEMRSNVDTQERARELLIRAALSLQFIEASGLRPVTTKLQRRSMKLVEEFPRRDHLSKWIAPSGQWIALDEPYGHVLKQPELGAREAWILTRGLHWARPSWDGLYFPGEAVPHLIAADKALLDHVVERVESLPPIFTREAVGWPGSTDTYWSQFVSPARQIAGTKRKPRPGTTYGNSKNAVEYFRHIGHGLRWRPDQEMSISDPVVVGGEFKRLYISPLPYTAHRNLSSAQSELEDWMVAEDRWSQREGTTYEAYYGGDSGEPFKTTDEQLIAIDRITAILKASYPDSAPLRRMVKRLAAARVAVAGS